jgi:hypothetical protein
MDKAYEELAAKIQAAKADLAFALAQGDGYAEDAADERIKKLEAELSEYFAARG